jgi:sugar transferase (PEP-CTERM/EpsH1 system associated)
MEPLLFLAHRIPYPPNKGDKITNFEFLRHFSRHFDVHLGTFIDDPRDAEHVDKVREFCRSAHFQPLNPIVSRLLSARSLLSGGALTLAYYPRRELRQWCERTATAQKIRRVFVSSTPMYQFVPCAASGAVKVIHYHDLDSDKWRQYADTKSWPLSMIYRREWRRLFDYERKIAVDADAGLFVTPSEADLFRKLAPESSHKIHWPGHGLDHDYYQRSEASENPYPTGSQAIVFVGVLDYWPNEDAAIWYAREIHGRVRAACPSARFYVVGMNPTRRVRELAALPGVVVTGQVPDVRPWFQHASAVVAPLRIARGIQNKVLQAMAMERPVVMSRMSAASLSAIAGQELEVADEAGEFAAKIVALLRNPSLAEAMGLRARERILRDYSWQRTLERIETLLNGAPSGTDVEDGASASPLSTMNGATA